MSATPHASHRSGLVRGMIVEAPAFITEEGRDVPLAEYLSDGGTFPADAVPKLWTVTRWDVEGGETEIVGDTGTGPLILDANVCDYPEFFTVVGMEPELSQGPNPWVAPGADPGHLPPHVEITVDGIGYEVNHEDQLALIALLRRQPVSPPQRQSMEIWADVIEGKACHAKDVSA